MNFFIWIENNVAFSRYLDIFGHISKSMTLLYVLPENRSYIYAYFLWFLSTMKIKYY